MAAEQKTVLLVDDDTELGAMLVEYLARFELTGTYVADPVTAIEECRSGKYQAVVLDVMMPKIDGLEVCRRIREFSAVPIIMLTALGDTADTVVGLSTGADDYLAKPFEPRILIARLQALMRRAQGALTHTETSNIVLNHRSGRALLRQQDSAELTDLHLTDTEFNVLAELIKHRPEPVSRNDLFALMRGFERNLDDRSIDFAISRLRKKLGDSNHEPKYIRTVRLVGYAFIG